MIELDQVGSTLGWNLTKLDQISSNWFELDEIGSSWFKLDETESNWIKLVYIN